MPEKQQETQASPRATAAAQWVCHRTFQCCAALCCVALFLSLAFLLLTLPLAGAPPSDEAYLRSPAYLSLRWKLAADSPPPPSPPSFF